MKRRWQDPEYRARMIAARARTAEDRRKYPWKYSRLMVPDGMRKAEAMAAWAEARTKAKRLFALWKEAGLIS